MFELVLESDVPDLTWNSRWGDQKIRPAVSVEIASSVRIPVAVGVRYGCRRSPQKFTLGSVTATESLVTVGSFLFTVNRLIGETVPHDFDFTPL